MRLVAARSTGTCRSPSWSNGHDTRSVTRSSPHVPSDTSATSSSSAPARPATPPRSTPPAPTSHPLVFEGSVTAGGALMNTTEVENFPGFRDGIMGPALMDEMRAQAERFGAELVADDVVAVDLTGDDQDRHRRPTGTVHRAAPVILATGSGYRELGLPDEERALRPRRLLVRDLRRLLLPRPAHRRRRRRRLRDRGGDLPDPVRPARSPSIHRRDELRASKIMQERAFADPKIEFAWNSEVADDPRRRPARPASRCATPSTGETRELDATGLFIAIGHDPRSRAAHGPGRPRRRGLRPRRRTRSTAHQPARRLRLRRPRRPPLPPGDHRRRHRLRRRPRRRALPRRPRGHRRARRGRCRGRRRSTRPTRARSPTRAPPSAPTR